MCFGGRSVNTGLFGQPNWDVNHPENMTSAPSFRDIHVGDYDFANPGQIDLHQTNPALQAQLDVLNQYGNGIGNRRSQGIQEAQTQASNLAAAQGLLGTSAGYGGVADAGRRAGLAWDDRSIQIAQMMAAGTLAGQSQYSNFQNQGWNSYASLMGLGQAHDQFQSKGWEDLAGGLISGGAKVGAAAI